MGRHRRRSVALAAALATAAAATMLVIDFAHPVPRLNVAAICLVIVTVGAWVAWFFVALHESTVETALKKAFQSALAEEHVEQRLRGLRTNADSDH